MSSRINSSKSYNVILEYLNISILSENLDWNNKILTLDKQIDFIPITIKHYNNLISNTNPTTLPLPLPLLITKNPALTYNDINNYWDNLSNDYKKHVIKNHFITPLCIVGDTLVLGVVVIGVEWKKYKLVETFNLLSVINNSCSNVKGDVNFNYILGIVKNLINKELLESKMLKVDNKIINWYYIFQNISGYLPKLKIIYKEKQKASINFFQNRLNP